MRHSLRYPAARALTTLALVGAVLSPLGVGAAGARTTAGAPRLSAATPLATTVYHAVALPNDSATQWYAVNGANQVVGTDLGGTSNNVAAKWDNGTVTTLPVPSDPLMKGYSQALAIDAAGNAFGTVRGATSGGYSTGFPLVWTPSGTPTAPNVGSYDGASSFSSASANGNVAGEWCGNNGSAYAPCEYVYGIASSTLPRTYQYTSLPGAAINSVVGSNIGALTTLISINDSGEIAVQYQTSTGPASYLLPQGAGGPATPAKVTLAYTPESLNDNGDVIGTTTSGPAIELADGTVEQLPPLRAGDTVTLRAINDSDQVVGQECGTSGCQPVIWNNLVPSSLSSAGGANVLGTLTNAIDISSNGTVLVYGTQNGQNIWYLLEAPTASISVSPHFATGTVAPGATTQVSVTISAPSSNTGDVTSVAWGASSPQGVTISPSAAATLTTALSPALPASLAPGQSVTVTGTLSASTKAQVASVASSITAVDAGGQKLSASGTTSLSIGVKPLTLAVATTPGEVQLPVDAKGKVGTNTVEAAVKFTNNTSSPLAGVQLLSLSPSPQNPTQQLDKLSFSSTTFPVKVATIPAKTSVVMRFPLKVTGDGTYVIRALALYPDPSASGGNGRATVQDGTFKSVVPLYYFKAAVDPENTATRGDTRWVKSGDPWYVKGTVKNLSSFQSLCLDPLVASTTGNADALGMQDVATSDPTSVDPPLAGTLKPGASKSLLMLVTTSSEGATRGQVTLPTDVYESEPGASCDVQANGSMTGTGAKLTAKQMSIVPDSTDFTVHVDVSMTDNSTWTGNGIAFFGGFAKGSIIGFANVAHGIYSMVRPSNAHFHEGQLYLSATTGNPAAVAELVGQANSKVQAMTALVAHYLETATPEEKQALSTQLSSAFTRASGDAYGSLSHKWDAVATAWFGDIVAAEKSGSAQDVWQAWGEADGNFITNVTLQVLATILGNQMQSQLAQMEARSAELTAQGSELTSMKGGAVVAGRELTLANEEVAAGITAEQDSALGAIAKKFNVLIGVRSRQAISVLKEKLGAVWKNSNFHQKTISPVDVATMDFPAADRGLLGFRSFTPAGKAAAQRKALEVTKNSSEFTEALLRVDGRIAENGSDFTKIQAMLNTKRNGVKGWVNAGFNATESGRRTSSVARWRRFAVEETKITDAAGTDLGTYYKPYQESIAYSPGRPIPELCTRNLIPGIVMCPITGDLDLSYIATVNGNGLSSSKMIDVFKALEEAGFAHTDLVTWVDQQTGSAMFPGKAMQLKDIAPGGEAVVQFAPDAIRRATYLDLAKSIITGPNNYQLTILGTYVPSMK